MKTFFLLLMLVVITGCSSDDSGENPPENPSNLPEQNVMNVAYGTHFQQKFDLYLPAGRTEQNTKVFVIIHGGGWMGGDKSEMIGVVNAFRANHPDYAIVNMNYVLATEQTYALPNQLLDIQAVLNYVSSRSGEYHIQPQFMLTGNSAGGHLSMHYAYSRHDSRVKAVCNIVGPTDFSDPYYQTNPMYSWYISNLVNPAAIPTGMNEIEYASPVSYVTASSVPTISFFGDTDNLVPLSQKTLLDQAHTSAGAVQESYVYSGGHNDWASPAQAAMLTQRIDTFVSAYFD